MDVMVSTDPMTGAEIWRGAASDVDAAVAAARAAAPGWARLPLDARIGLVRRFQAVVRDRADDFARLIARETGKPCWEARTEVASVAAKVDISITAQAERAGERAQEAGGIRQAVRHKPHGVLAVLGPFNFPAHLPNGHIVPALLAGNTIVFKPSEKTPATAEFMATCWRDAGLPDGVLMVAQGGGETGRALAAHPDIDGLLFTGSGATGAALHRQFADRPGRILALEMGGNNPLVLWDVAAAQRAPALHMTVQSAFLSAGQRCTCARRLIVSRDEGPALVKDLAVLLDRIVIGGPFDDPAPFMGPVIDAGAADALLRGFDGLAAAGGRVIRPLERIEGHPALLRPALIDMTDARTEDVEHFGPVLQVRRVADFDAAIAEANATAYGLAAGLIGGDRALYDRFWAESRAGVVNWNRPTTGAASNAPFGGIGLSGNHRASAYYAADYAAWPVASLEAPVAEGLIAEGLREAACSSR